MLKGIAIVSAGGLALTAICPSLPDRIPRSRARRR
jgi:hypothetical protein